VKVDIRIKNENWQRDLQEAAMNTINQTPEEAKKLTEELFRKYILSEHSPIRGIELRITLYDIPYHNSVHFARHVHSIPYVSTHRPDRIKRQRTLDDKCEHMMDINLQGLIDMARKRLCVGKCDKITYDYMEAIKKAFIDKGGYYKIIGDMLVPNCVYRNGCPEFKPCGFFKQTDKNIPERYAVFNDKVK